jgi:hypothetical protein
LVKLQRYCTAKGNSAPTGRPLAGVTTASG